MLIGIDWGGTKIEAIALTEEGKEILRLREKTPRHDYNGCIQIIVKLVERIEQETGRTCPVGIGIPGSLEPKSRLGKGASSTWLLGRPVERDLRAALGREIRVENDADCLAALGVGGRCRRGLSCRFRGDPGKRCGCRHFHWQPRASWT